ncbi:MAG TPA: tRNA (adenosine(37)-N6)-dimethylallyltransferase MiaA [Thermoanaerobaculia bacterium]|nr:tRNA (adenosine(37)-N6)-dimethylallyltransferase MiaA [Thermoanaerobaculia bacterium]
MLGPTGAGKSELAHGVARIRGGEIVSADAFAVYRGLDVGTDKPSPERRRQVPYHLIDVADPDETYSAGRWQHEARAVIEEITARGRLPIVCGGSGFYIQALLEGLPPGEARDPVLRAALTRWGSRNPAGARRLLRVNDPAAAGHIAPGNLRYVLRALEVLLVTGRRPSARLPGRDTWASQYRVTKVGVSPTREDLYARIARRVREMLESGWEEEVRRLLAEGYSSGANAFGAIGYREMADAVLSGHADALEVERKIVTATRQLARRQATWFRRERDVVWMEPEGALARTLALLDTDSETGRHG